MEVLFITFILATIICPPINCYLSFHLASSLAIVAGLCLVVVVANLFGEPTLPIADGAAVVPELHRLADLLVSRRFNFDDILLCAHI